MDLSKYIKGSGMAQGAARDLSGRERQLSNLEAAALNGEGQPAAQAEAPGISFTKERTPEERLRAQQKLSEALRNRK